MKFRLDVKSAKSSEVIEVLKKLYCTAGYIREGRLADYSRALMDLLLQLCELSSDSVSNKGRIIKDMFAERVSDTSLTSELKCLNVESPIWEFHEVQECAQQRTEDVPQQSKPVQQDSTCVAAASRSNETLLQTVEDQSKKIAELGNLVEDLRSYNTR